MDDQVQILMENKVIQKLHQFCAIHFKEFIRLWFISTVLFPIVKT
jgi:hypothetical protein